MNHGRSIGSHARYCLIAAAGLCALVAVSCGGGGGSAPAYLGGTVNVSLASVPQDASPASQAGTAAPDILAQPSPADDIDHAWVTIYRVALLPGPDGGGPDPSGEPSVEGEEGYPGMIAGEISPAVEVDLLDLPQGQAALFLNAIDNVPAGTYKKIRLFYTNPKVHFKESPDNTSMHPTANFHLDIHFKGGSLVVPVATGSEGGVVVHDVTVFFEPGKDGLKITVNPNKILMRPQVFATVGAVQYLVSGFADNVVKEASSFDLLTGGGGVFHVLYDNGNTGWGFLDNGTKQQVAIDNNLLAIAALRDGASVDVYGMFTGAGTLFADNVVIVFTDAISGPVAPGVSSPGGWLADNTFVLSFPGDNVVIPMPSRTEARYDNNADLSQTFADDVIKEGTFVRARGYAATDGVEAYWISVGP
jgi:hypothetical protein